MSEWLFDLGNSRLKFAPLLDDGGVGEMAGIAHDGHALAEGWASLLPARIDAAHVASVAAPALRVQLLEALTARSGRNPGCSRGSHKPRRPSAGHCRRQPRCP